MAEVREIPPSEHAEYGASSAHRWMNCPGSLVLSKDAMRPTPSEVAAEGTVAHFVAAECIQTGVAAEEYIGDIFRTDGFQFTVDRAMAESIQVYLDNITEYAAGSEVLVEVEVNYSKSIGTKPEKAWGTSDAIIVRPEELGVHDLKFGRGEDVAADDNEQMQLYGLGALEEYGGLMGYDDTTKVVMAIHQPRIKKAPKEWSATVGELKVFAERAKLAMHATVAALWGYAAWKNDGRSAEGWLRFEQEYLKPGEKQCRWCHAKSGCSALRKSVTRTVMNADPVTPDEFESIKFEPKKHVAVADNQWLGAALAQAPLIEAWLKALYQTRDQRVLSGQHVPGFKPVIGNKGDRKWLNAIAVEQTLKVAMRLPDTAVYKRTLASPAAIEALTKGKEPMIGKRQWEKLQELIVREDGRPTVVPESDPRPAIEVRPVEEEFDDLTQQIADDIG